MTIKKHGYCRQRLGSDPRLLPYYGEGITCYEFVTYIFQAYYKYKIVHSKNGKDMQK
jgi:hypothetical protein